MIQMKHALVVALASVALGGLAHGGFKHSIPVWVDTGYRQAYGALGSVRNSVDSTQSIGCALSAWATTVSGSCEARNETGTTAACYFSNNPNLEKALMSLTPDSWIFFTWSTDGRCEYIQSYTESMLEPKK